MTDDFQLLRDYAENGSEAAFGELARRHINLVYSAALRQTAGDAHLAQDVTQSVFTDLARKARRLSHDVVVSGWLYQATRYAAAKAVRTERRRINREQEAVAMQDSASEHSTDWDRLQPVLDEAMSCLPTPDRDAVLLRFFERKELREIGNTLGTTEEAARKRVSRALEKLRGYLAQRGVTLTSTALATALTAGATQAAPVSLAAIVSTSAVATAATATGFGYTLLNTMSMIKLKTALVTAVVAAGVGTPLVLQHQSNQKLRAENASLQEQIQKMGESRPANAEPATPDADELARLREQLSELMRLRAEVTRLRRDQAETQKLAAENAQLRGALQAKAKPDNPQPPPSSPEEEFRAQNIQRMKQARQLALGLHMFAQDNEGQLPRTFDDALKYIGGEDDLVLASETEFELVYAGRFDEIANPDNTILLREKALRISPDGRYARTYGFADGHTEIRSSLTDDFAEWEKQRAATPTGSRLQTTVPKGGSN